MLDFSMSPMNSQLRALSRYQHRLIRHRKFRAAALGGKVI